MGPKRAEVLLATDHVFKSLGRLLLGLMLEPDLLEVPLLLLGVLSGDLATVEVDRRCLGASVATDLAHACVRPPHCFLSEALKGNLVFFRLTI